MEKQHRGPYIRSKKQHQSQPTGGYH